ncbi:hypothetical protein D9M68_474780 [compost metagenome]
MYVSGYKIGTATDNDGKFNLPNLAPGKYDILVQMIGYLPFNQNVIITDESVKIEVVLLENISSLNEVVIKHDPDREYHLSLFKAHFIGKSPNAINCKILNENAISTHFDREKNILTVSANEFVIVENKALGYRIKYMLQAFEYNLKTRIIYYAGLPTFEEIKGSIARTKSWEKKRILAYNGSMQHFYTSLFHDRTEENGFQIYKLVKTPNPQRQTEEIINSHIKRLSQKQIVFNGSDSLSYWLKQKKLTPLINTLIKQPILTDTLVKTYTGDMKQINFRDILYVVYKNEREHKDYQASGNQISRPADLRNYQISLINLLQGPVAFYANGALDDPRTTLYEGYWVYEKIADLVPLDYIPK